VVFDFVNVLQVILYSIYIYIKNVLY